MPNLTPSDVHTDREMKMRKRRNRSRYVMPKPILDDVEKHGHKGEPGYELLHPGHGKKPSLPTGWTARPRVGKHTRTSTAIFLGPNDYRVTYAPHDTEPSWKVERKFDAAGRQYREIGRFATPDKAFAGARNDFRKFQKQQAEKARGEAEHAAARDARIRAEREDRARRTRLAALPVRTSGRRPSRGAPNPVVEDKAPAVELPGIPDAVNVGRAEMVIRAFDYNWQKTYARMVLRLGKQGNSIDPDVRVKRSQNDGVALREYIGIENAIHAALFPETLAPKKRKTRTQIGIANPTGIQEKAITENGGRKIHVLLGNKTTGKNEGVAFKANKGQHKGQYLIVSGNGTTRVVDEPTFQQTIENSAAEDAKQMAFLSTQKWSHREKRFIPADVWERQKAEEERAIAQTLHDAEMNKFSKIERAKKWALEHGYDPEDSYWWGVFWNDPSLVRAKYEGDDEEGDQFNAPIQQKVGPPPVDIPASELPLGRRRRSIKGWRFANGKAVVAEHKQNEQPKKGVTYGPMYAWAPGDYRIYWDGKQVGDSTYPTRSAAITGLKAWLDEVMNKPRVVDVPAGPVKGRRGEPTQYGPAEIDEKGNPIPKGTRRRKRVVRKHGDPDITPPALYRAMHPGGRKGAPWDGYRLNVLPRRGEHQKKDVKREFKPKTYLNPSEAHYLRNNGPLAISDKRLGEIFNDPTVATETELSLILSAGGNKEYDGVKKIKVYVVRSGEYKMKERYDIIGQIRSKMAAGSGDRSATRSTLSEDRRQRANVKRRESGKNSYERERRQMIEDWSLDGKTMICIFCGRKVSNSSASMETPKPKALGGGYTRGNIFPAHESCNTKHGGEAQRNPKLYYEIMFSQDYYFNPKRVPPQLRKKLDPIFKKTNRKFFR